jgi:glyoxylase-like metal-dependent hydrolase (beta-lactamase superfamily II)
VFLTHGHLSQSAGAAALPRARVHAGAGDLDPSTGRQLPEQGLQRVLDLFLPRPGWTVADPIDREREIPLRGGGAVLALPVPGHSPGSIAYLANGVLYVGEVVSYRDGKLTPGPRLLDADPEQSARSMAGLARRLADVPVTRICTSRSRCTPDGVAQALLQALAAAVAR